MTSEGKKLLGAVLAHFRGSSVESLTIKVYSDTHGVPTHNKLLTQRRANAVRNEATRVLPRVEVRALGMGQANPVASNETADGRWRNRRVEIRFGVKRPR
jgi:OOP family OmpA-OmpF porin